MEARATARIGTPDTEWRTESVDPYPKRELSQYTTEMLDSRDRVAWRLYQSFDFLVSASAENFCASAMLPLILSFPPMKAAMPVNFPVAMATKSASEMVSVQSGFAPAPADTEPPGVFASTVQEALSPPGPPVMLKRNMPFTWMRTTKRTSRNTHAAGHALLMVSGV